MTISFQEALAARGIDQTTVKRRAHYHANKHKRPGPVILVRLTGGPWHDQRIPLTRFEGGTLPISCQGYRGAYLESGLWHCMELLPPARRVTGPAGQYNLIPG